MTSAFISYSRTDLHCALHLRDALQARGQTLWIDLERLEPTEQWKRAIYQAIDDADAFLSMISPDALDSAFCREELAYALENKKRIIPVVVRKVSARDVSKPVADLQWIFYLQEQDSGRAVDAILQSLQIDHEHRHLGSYLLGRARRWEDNEQKGGILTGKELKDAEQWLVESAKKPQGATALHIRLISASQHRASLLRRIVTIVSVMVTLVISSLGIVSAIQAAIANQQRDLAFDRLSQALASLVPTSLQQDAPDQSILLALTALKIHDTLLARGSLWQTFAAYPRLQMILEGHTTSDSNRGLSPGVSDLVYDPATKMLLSSGLGDGDIIQWNPATGEHRSFALPRYENRLGIFGLALSPDGRLLASAGTGGVWVWNAWTGEPVSHLPIDAQALAFSPDGRLVTITCFSPCRSGSYTIALWDATTGAWLLSFGYPRRITALALSRDGRTMATNGCVQDNRGQPAQPALCAQDPIQLWDTETGQPLGQPLLSHRGAITSLDFRPDGTQLASGTADGSVILWSVATRSMRGQPFKAHSLEVTRVRFSPDGEELATASLDARIGLWNAADGTLLGSMTGPGSMVLSLAFSPDGQQLASGDQNNRIMLWRVGSPGDTLVTRHFSAANATPRSVAISPDGRVIAVGGTEGSLTILDRSSGAIIQRRATSPLCRQPLNPESDRYVCYLGAMAFSRDGSRLLAGWNGHLAVWDTRTWTYRGDPLLTDDPCGTLLTMLCQDTAPYAMAFNADMSMLAVLKPGQIWVWSISQGRLLFHLQGHTGQITSAAFSSDGRMLATGGQDTTILLWDLENGQRIGSPLRGHTGPIIQLAFNPRRDQLVSSSYDNTIRFWDVQTGQFLHKVDNSYLHTSGLLTFSPDGNYLATTTWHATTEQPFASPYSVTLLDTQTYQAALPALTDAAETYGLTFTPDGTQVVSVPFLRQSDSSDVLVTLRNYRIDALQELACQVVQHNLTIEQVNAFSPGFLQVCQRLPVDTSVVRSQIEQAATAAAEGNARQARDAYLQSTTWVTQPENRDPELNNFLCLHGSVHLFAREVLDACNHAVMLAEVAGDYRDSRGIARALVGDEAGAIQDFQAFVAWAQKYRFDAQLIQERQSWIRVLQLHQNPFTSGVLAHVWLEYRWSHDTGF